MEDRNKIFKQRARELKWLNVSNIPKNLMDFLQLDFTHKNILLNRMSGMTLQETGKIEGITRERVRQIESKLLKILPQFDDVEVIKKIVLTYDINENQFVEYFHRPKEIFQYIVLKNKKNKNARPFEEYLLNVNRTNPKIVSKALQKKKKFINYAGDIVDLNINNVIDQVLFDDHSIYTIDKLEEAIKEFFAKNAFEDEQMIAPRALVGRVSKKEHVIQSTKGKFRYYKYDVETLKEFIPDLDKLFNVADGIYGINYFFESDRELMTLLDIHNGSELANVLKKIGYQSFPRLNGIVRQSQVYIGTVHRDKKSREHFYQSILLKFDGQMLDDVIRYIHENYYLHKGTSLAYISKNFSSVIHQKMIVMNVELPRDFSFYDEAKKSFKKPIYSFEQVLYLLRKIDRNVTFSPQLMDKLGYYERGTFFLKKEFDNQNAAFESLWLKRDYVFIDDVRQFRNRIADSKAYQLELSHDLLRINRNRYMTIKKFEQSGFSKDDIPSFINQVISFTRAEKFYSWKYIIDKGFESTFIGDTNFEDYFYERLLFTSPAIRTIQTNKYIFVNNNEYGSSEPSLAELLKCELGSESRDVEDFTDDINQKYGLSLDKAKVIEKLKNAGAVYSPEMNKFYANKRLLYTEIYNLKGEDINDQRKRL